MKNLHESKNSINESTRDKFRKGIGVTLATAGILLAPACANDDGEVREPITTHSQELTEAKPAQNLEFETAREAAEQVADRLSSQLLDSMEDPNSHTQVLDTGVRGIANKKYIVQNTSAASPEFRALYRPEGGTLYLLGTQSYEQEDGSYTHDRVSTGYSVGAETRLSLQDKALEDFDARTIRQILESGDTELVSVEAQNQENTKESVMFVDAFASEQITAGKFDEITPGSSIAISKQ